MVQIAFIHTKIRTLNDQVRMMKLMDMLIWIHHIYFIHIRIEMDIDVYFILQ